MPIAPYKKFSVGKMSTPILAKSLATKLDAKYVLAINALDAYKERDIDSYIELLKKYDIEPDIYWIDSEHKIELLNKLNYLIDNKYIYCDKRNIMSCDCKQVEIPVENIKTINLTDACFYEDNGYYYCKNCHSMCKIAERNSLIFNPQLITDKTFTFYPEFINKDIKTFNNTILTNEIVISRERETGITLDYAGKSYNIDIDFLWGLYLSLFPNCDKIVMCSNHQLYQLYMVTLLEKCFKNEGKTIALATPYLNVDNKNKEKELEDRLLSLKIFTILNQKFAKKENIFDEGLLNYVNNMNVNKKQMLYEILMEQNREQDILMALKTILVSEFNFQNANRELKRRRRNV